MAIHRPPARRVVRRRQPPHRSLTREEELAQLICRTINPAGCVCEIGKSPSTCEKLVYTAKRAIRFVEGLEP